MITYKQMTDLFETANDSFLNSDIDLFESGVSERTLCGALAHRIHDIINKTSIFNNYYVDVEYNRNKGGKIKQIVETTESFETKIITINCDIILHSRGTKPEQDNLIAVEMEKSTRDEAEKEKDKRRLIALTKDSFDDIWSYDGKTLPEYVCRYILGVYYEIDYTKRVIYIEYYKQGELQKSYARNF